MNPNFDFEVQNARERLAELGIDISNNQVDYYKIPIENTDLQKIEQEMPKNQKYYQNTIL